jgi:hypothetical protein
LKNFFLGISAIFMFAGLTYTYSTLSKSRAAEVPATPVTPVANGGHSTGGVKATAGGYSIQLDYNARANPLKGMVKYSDTLGMSFMGKVDKCYTQSGDMAVFAGTVEKGSVAEAYFLVEVQDNGEGKKATGSDMLGVSFSNVVPTCTINPALLNAVVTKGNLQVHTN